MHYLLFYRYIPDVLEKRGAYRAAHLQYAWAAQNRGELVLAGAYAEPVDGAALLFKADTPAVAEAFAINDPYVKAGLVTSWTVRAWTTVVGDAADSPIHPIP